MKTNIHWLLLVCGLYVQVSGFCGVQMLVNELNGSKFCTLCNKKYKYLFWRLINLGCRILTVSFSSRLKPGGDRMGNAVGSMYCSEEFTATGDHGESDQTDEMGVEALQKKSSLGAWTGLFSPTGAQRGSQKLAWFQFSRNKFARLICRSTSTCIALQIQVVIYST